MRNWQVDTTWKRWPVLVLLDAPWWAATLGKLRLLSAEQVARQTRITVVDLTSEQYERLFADTKYGKVQQ